MNKPFTLVTTVFNEMRRLDNTIRDIENQTLKPTEIVIVDAGSKDGTLDRLDKWSKESSISIKVIVKPKCNVAEGRNLAIKEATYPLIASTDFGCQYHPKWLESIMTPFEDPSVRCTVGSFTVQEELVKNLAQRADWILQNGYQTALDEFFVPSSRSIAYYKDVWEECGEYPEWLTLTADDTIFYYVLKKKGIPYKVIPEPYVYWIRHTSAKAFYKESYRYGVGQGEGKISLRNFFSTTIETGIRWGFFLNLLLVIINGIFCLGLPAWWALTLIPMLVGFRSYKNAYKNWQGLKNEKYNLQAYLYALVMIEYNRYYHIKGYIEGYWFADERKQKGAAELAALLNS